MILIILTANLFGLYYYDPISQVRTIEAQRSRVTCLKSLSWHQHAKLCATWAIGLPRMSGGWGLGCASALTNVHRVGVGERLGRQDGVLQSFLVVGGWWLVIGVIFHRCLFLLIGGLIVTIIFPVLVIIGTFIVIFFLPAQ